MDGTYLKLTSKIPMQEHNHAGSLTSKTRLAPLTPRSFLIATQVQEDRSMQPPIADGGPGHRLHWEEPNPSRVAAATRPQGQNGSITDCHSMATWRVSHDDQGCLALAVSPADSAVIPAEWFEK